MRLSDYHTHTTFCDGNNTPSEMAKAACKLGMDTLGFSVHYHTPFDESYCIKKERIPDYIREIAALKRQYEGRLRILCGIEQDVFSPDPTEEYDYIIGSVHYVKTPEGRLAVDMDKQYFCKIAEKHFGGDFIALAEQYFENVAALAEMKKLDIIGHFDLVTKYNKGHQLFDETHPRYVAAWQRAADVLLRLEKPFEINSGAIIRGYTDRPYPSDDILRYLCKHGASVIINSDSHSTDTLCFDFERRYEKAGSIGFSADRIVTL